ncbi:MAG: cysteine dioxygenase, partial [Streptosporangiaceae bacterium]
MSVATVSPGGAGVENYGAEAHGSSGRDDGKSGLKPGWGVSPERQQAIVDTMRHLAPHSGRLSPAQLRAITVELSARRELWSDLVVRDPDVRWYLPLHRSNSCDVWLLAWERGQDTDWHDHGGSSGSFTVAEGSLVERYRGPSGRRLARRRLTLGEVVAFGPGHVHDVAHGGEASATSIHAYSPPLSAMTYYSATDYGLIARETVAIDGPEGARGRGGADTALARATASAAKLTSD